MHACQFRKHICILDKSIILKKLHNIGGIINMSNKEILENIKKLSKQEKRNFSYDNLVEIMSKLKTNEIIELSNIIGIYKIMYGNIKT